MTGALHRAPRGVRTGVTLYLRKPRRAQNFSIELVFEELHRALPDDIEARFVVSRFESSGVLRRLYNVIEAAFRQGDVNHVTGDVHILTYLLDPARTVLTIHDCAGLRGPLTLRKRALRALWYRLPVRRSAVVTVVSEHARAELVSHVPEAAGKVLVIPSIVPSTYQRDDRVFCAERPTVLQVGTASNKNLLRAIEALAGLPYKLLLVGPLEPAQRKALSEHRIDYEAFEDLRTDQLAELYRRCDVVLFASTFEGFGMPIVEANRVGRVVVTSQVASMPEVGGDAAHFVDPFDVASIRAGLMRVVDDASYREQLVQNGHRNALRFDSAKIAERYASVYRSLAHSASAPRRRAPASIDLDHDQP